MPPKKKHKSMSVGPVDGQTAGKRVFRCQFCAKEFLRNEHLQRHERLHTKEKPFRCTACSVGFTRSDLLARHTRYCHDTGNAIASEDHEGSASHLDNSPQRTRDTPSGLDSTPLPPTSPDAGYMPCPEPSALLNHEAPFDASLAPAAEAPVNAPPIPWSEPASNFGDFALFIDSMTMPYGGSLPNFAFDIPPTQVQHPHVVSSDMATINNPSAPRLFDEFTSTFPSFDPSPSGKASHEPWKITQDIWDHLFGEIQDFTPLLPPHFFLPSRHTMTRYIATYFSGFHRHLPFLHVPTFSPTRCPAELVLAMATIGAQSAFDNDNAVMFYRAAFAIVQERLRQRKAQQRERIFFLTGSQPHQGPLRPSSPPRPGSDPSESFDPLPIAQTLLLLMAVATWGNSQAIFNEAFGIQNILTSHIREERLLSPPSPQDTTWDQWIQAEGFNRIICIIFCFLIFHTIVYDTPPPIRNSELTIHLPSREADWEAPTEAEWKEARSKSPPASTFQSSLSNLFSAPSDQTQPLQPYSSLGGYTLILALIQHIYFLRETSKHKPNPNPGSTSQPLNTTDITNVETALRNWQTAWHLDPESFLGPGNPKGPISFNSSALLCMAYIRLTVDVGPWRALVTHNPTEIAASMHNSPPLMRDKRLTRAVLYSAHALSIPVKIGVNIVARNQAFAWSLQHALCGLECAFVISRWLVAVQRSEGSSSGGSGSRAQAQAESRPLDEEEARLLAYINDMVTEADPVGEFAPRGSDRDLCTRVIRIWAKLLSGEAVWDVVRLIGRALDAYVCVLESRAI